MAVLAEKKINKKTGLQEITPTDPVIGMPYIFLAKSREIHPAPDFSLPQRVAPSPLDSWTIVKMPLPVN